MDATGPDAALRRDAALYRVVLEHWRRSHCECTALGASLRQADAELALASHTALRRCVLSRHGTALQHAMRLWSKFSPRDSLRLDAVYACLRTRRGLSMQNALRTWGAACARLAVLRSMELIRRERAARVELETQLEALQDSEREMRRLWQNQQEQELALVASLAGASTHVVEVPPPLAPQQPPAPVPVPPTSLVAVTHSEPVNAARPSHGPLGTRAEMLVAAFRRETSAAAGSGSSSVAAG